MFVCLYRCHCFLWGWYAYFLVQHNWKSRKLIILWTIDWQGRWMGFLLVWCGLDERELWPYVHGRTCQDLSFQESLRGTLSPYVSIFFWLTNESKSLSSNWQNFPKKPQQQNNHPTNFPCHKFSFANPGNIFFVVLKLMLCINQSTCVTGKTKWSLTDTKVNHKWVIYL